jgi:acyl carrier protein
MNLQQIAKRITANVSTKFGVSTAGISIDSSFQSIGANSIDIVEIILDMEQEFHINVPDNKLVRMKSVGSLAKFIDASLNNKIKSKYSKKIIN